MIVYYRGGVVIGLAWRGIIETVLATVAGVVIGAFLSGCPVGQRIMREVGHFFVGNKPDAVVVHVLPRPTPAQRLCSPYDDHHSPEACALLRDPHAFDPNPSAPTGATAEDCAAFLLVAVLARETNPHNDAARQMHAVPECRALARLYDENK